MRQTGAFNLSVFFNLISFAMCLTHIWNTD